MTRREGRGETPEEARDRSREERRDGGRATAAPVCELCGGPVLERHCKITCLNCGYQRDCSDP